MSTIADAIPRHFMTTLCDRFHHAGLADLPDTLPIVVGKREDYLALKPHHYRPSNPATMTRILSIYDTTPTAADRYLQRPAAPRPIAVLTESLPTLSCLLRDRALGGRYGHLRPKPRAALLNQELRCISRVIVDPRWRGLGLAVRLVRQALRTATTRYTEALAAMGHISPFFDRAGMVRYERPALPVEQRAIDALRYAGIAPIELALPAELEVRIEALDQPVRALVVRELTRWYRTAGGRGISRQSGFADVLATARDRLLARPIYYLHENTDA